MTSGPTLSSPVVSTQWLADYLGADKLVVLDASVIGYTQPGGAPGYTSGRERFLVDGHIPGAHFADVIQALSDPDGSYPFTHPSAERFSAAVGALGISNTTTVVVYDSAVGQWAARVWWLFRTFGYDKVAVLDGGFTKWSLEARPTEIGNSPAPKAAFISDERPELWVDRQFVEGVVSGTIDAALVCASPANEYSGAVTPRPRAGHIPGSVSVPAVALVDDQTHAIASDAELRRRFAPALGKPRIVLYCGGGIAAAADALALTLLGETSLSVYDGSLNEWTSDPALRLVTVE